MLLFAFCATSFSLMLSIQKLPFVRPFIAFQTTCVPDAPLSQWRNYIGVQIMMKLTISIMHLLQTSARVIEQLCPSLMNTKGFFKCFKMCDFNSIRWSDHQILIGLLIWPYYPLFTLDFQVLGTLENHFVQSNSFSNLRMTERILS